MPTPEEVLRSEFNAENGTFLLKARCDHEWDKAAFARLVSAMYDVAAANQGADRIPRWIAQGYWYFDTSVRAWTTHPNFPSPGDEYRENALTLIGDLAYFLFFGESPLKGNELEERARGMVSPDGGEPATGGDL
jgi:hypothetical protein